MKKRIWITLLALILALGAFCIGASAEDGTFAASVTSNGVTQHYETVQEAFNAAKDGDTVGILNFNTTEAEELSIEKNLTVDLGGSVTDLYSLRFRVSGSVTFISAGLNGNPAAFAPIVVVENGGMLTGLLTVDGDVNVDGTLTVSGAEYENSYPGMDRRIYIHSGGEVKIHGGSCNKLDVVVYCWDNVTLRGGFGEIWVRAYEVLEDQTVKKLDNIGSAQYAAMLDAGKGYRKSGGTFAGTADVTEDVYANPDYPYKVLQNVTVTDAPFKGLRVTGDSSVAYGGSVALMAKMDTEPTGVTYQWYRNGTATPDRTALIYGEKLSSITLSGEMSYNGAPVAGTFEWVNPDEVPEIGEYDADWVFEPAADETYLPVTGTVRITVSPAAYSVTVAASFAEDNSVLNFFVDVPNDTFYGFTGAWMFRLPFTDTVDWAYEPTTWCYMHGITEGVSETEFGSNDPCKRAHIVTFLWRAFGE